MLLNAIGFNFVWFGLVYWGDNFIPVALMMLFIHLKEISTFPNEIRLVLVIAMIGFVNDSLLSVFGVFQFEHSIITPLWLIVLWASFATTISHSLSFLNVSKTLQIAVGGLVAPLSYIAGYKLDAVAFGYPIIPTYLLLSANWAVLFLIFFSLRNTLINKEVTYA